jgi:hypothetical protein
MRIPGTRQDPRVVLRNAIDARFDGAPILVLELGLGGARFEHGQRMDIGRRGEFTCGPLEAYASVRHSIVLPAEGSVVYHTGLSFSRLDPPQKEHLFKLLIDEAQEQLREWEANLGGIGWSPSVIRQSAVARRYIALRPAPEGWRRTISTDPNQPLDGITVIDDTPEEDIDMLCRTYQNGDDATHELLRRMAILTIVERLHR